MNAFGCNFRGLALILVALFVASAPIGCGPGHGRAEVGGATLFNYDDNNVVVVKNNIGGVVLQVGGAMVQTGHEVRVPLGYTGGYGGEEVTVDVLQEGPDGLIYIGVARRKFRSPYGYYGRGDRWAAPHVWVVNTFESVRDLNDARVARRRF